MAKKKDAEVYEIPALIVTPDKAPVIEGNYAVIEKTLKQWKASVSSMTLTEDNMNEVVTIKKAAVAVRNRLKEAIEDTKRRLFNDPKAIFEARARQLTNLVADVENCADTVLDKLEQQRIDEVNNVLDHYRNELQKVYQLEDMSGITYPKDFFNKTVPKGYSSMDRYWRESLKAQFIELKKTQKAYEGNVRLIENACKDTKELNPQIWIGKLAHEDIASVLEQIDSEKIRLQEVKEEVVSSASIQETSGVAEEKITLGVPVSINFNSDFPGRKSKMSIQISYPCDLGDALTDLFKELKQYGISVKRLKEEVVF